MAVIVRYRKVNDNKFNIYLDSYKDVKLKTEILPGYVVTRDYSNQSHQSFTNNQDEEFVIKAKKIVSKKEIELLTGSLPVNRKIELFHYLEH